MLPDCKIQKVQEIKTVLKKNNIVDTLTKAYQPFQLESLFSEFTPFKKQGYSLSMLFLTLLVMPYLNANTVHSLYKNAFDYVVGCGKDSLYRFKNNEWIPWRTILYRFNKRYNELVIKNGASTESAKPKCFLADDSILGHTGKTIEGISKVHDHNLNTTRLGFKWLVLGWFDGFSFRPLDFSLHREGQNSKRKRFGLAIKWLKKQFSKKREQLSSGYKRFKELDVDKNTLLIQMIKRAVKHGYVPDYVLFDSWFCCEKTLKAIRGIRKGIIHVIAACKMGNAKYKWIGANSEFTAHQILQKLRKYGRKPTRCRKLNAKYYSVVVTYKGVELKLFFIKYGKSKKWKLLVNTRSKLSFIKTMEIYAIRWAIEVFFKETKQLLGVQKCASKNFDAHIAHTSITIIQYLMLCLHKRFSDYETIGGLFKAIQQQYIQANIAQRLWNIFIQTIQCIVQKLDCDIEQLLQLIIYDTQFRRLFEGAIILKVQNE